MITACIVEGCETMCYSGPKAMRPPEMSRPTKGMCQFHYHRTVQGVDLHAPQRGPAKDGCAIPGCAEPWYCKDWCHLHYCRQYRGQDMAAPKKRSTASQRDEFGNKHCAQCNEWLPPGEFYKHSGTGDGLSALCSVCSRRRHKEGGYGSPARLHKIGVERYQELVAGGCESCGATDKLQVDHDHSCCPGEYSCGNCVRGCLCGSCNRALGLLGDTADGVIGLLNYLTACPAI